VQSIWQATLVPLRWPAQVQRSGGHCWCTEAGGWCKRRADHWCRDFGGQCTCRESGGHCWCTEATASAQNPVVGASAECLAVIAGAEILVAGPGAEGLAGDAGARKPVGWRRCLVSYLPCSRVSVGATSRNRFACLGLCHLWVSLCLPHPVLPLGIPLPAMASVTSGYSFACHIQCYLRVFLCLPWPVSHRGSHSHGRMCLPTTSLAVDITHGL